MNRTAFTWLGLLTLFGFSLLGILSVELLQDVPFREVFFSGWNWLEQLGIGLAYGSICAGVAWWLIQRPFMRELSVVYAGMFKSLELSVQDVLFISLCAGVGEEILFRAGIQPFLGIWLTSVLFVAIHGYLDPRSWRMFLYGSVMTVMIAGVGWLFENVGLISAMTAHFIIDVILLLLVMRMKIVPD